MNAITSLGGRLLLVSSLLGFLFVFAALFEAVRAKPQSPQSLSDIPGNRLVFVSQVLPCRWDVEGLLSSFDLIKIVLRRAGVQLDPGIVHGRDYGDRHIDLLEAFDLIKLEILSDRLEVLSAPQRLVMMPNYNYTVPLLVRNRTESVQQLEVETPFKHYELPVPPESIRGYSLNLSTARLGIQTDRILLSNGKKRSEISMDFDVRPETLLKVLLVDSDGQPTAARVYLTGSDGLAHSPSGSLQRIARPTGIYNGIEYGTGHSEYFFHADSSFEVVLPAGKTVIEAVRGLEYAPVRHELDLQAQPHSMELKLDHRLPLYQKGFYSADSHIHANYINNEVIDLEDIQLQVKAEGLDIANMMVANSFSGIVHDLRFFEGRPHRSSKGRKVLYWNEEMRNLRIYGHMSFFNLKELVHRLFTGFPGTKHFEDYPPNYTQAKAAREQGGAVAYVHPSWNDDFVRTHAREFPVDLALGQVDALDVLSNADERASMKLWYRVLNCGFRCAVSAGTDAFTNLMLAFLLGGDRVYVHVPGKFTYEKWIENYKSGKSFATNGPMLELTVDGRRPGEELQLKSPARVSIRAEATALWPLDQLEIVANGRVVASQKATGDRHRIVYSGNVSLERSSWIAARVTGPDHRMLVNDRYAFAHTSPVYCLVANQPITSATDAAFWVDWIDQLIGRVREVGVFATPEKRESVVALFQRARRIYADQADAGP